MSIARQEIDEGISTMLDAEAFRLRDSGSGKAVIPVVGWQEPKKSADETVDVHLRGLCSCALTIRLIALQVVNVLRPFPSALAATSVSSFHLLCADREMCGSLARWREIYYCSTCVGDIELGNLSDLYPCIVFQEVFAGSKLLNQNMKDQKCVRTEASQRS
jgi:hypothetical protein